ncbi:hypothetical protein NL676_025243 [Syzygium grande]|nr:hypothetical protein NL676_025243 [Syzygium grande]
MMKSVCVRERVHGNELVNAWLSWETEWGLAGEFGDGGLDFSGGGGVCWGWIGSVRCTGPRLGKRRPGSRGGLIPRVVLPDQSFMLVNGCDAPATLISRSPPRTRFDPYR